MKNLVLTGTEYESFENDFRIAIAATWEAIVNDVEDSGYFDGDLESIVEITLDANHVESYGKLVGNAGVAWKKFYRNESELPTQLATDVLKDYI